MGNTITESNVNKVLIGNEYGRTPLLQLLLTSKKVKESDVLSLLELKADVHIQDRNGHNALSASAYMRHTEVIQHILNANGDVDFSNHGNLAIHYAARNCRSEDGMKTLQLLIDGKSNVNFQANRTSTPLVAAASSGQPAAIKLLVDSHADVNLGNENGYRPLHYTVIDNENYPQNDNARMLLQCGAYVDHTDMEGHTVLHFASRSYYKGNHSDKIDSQNEKMIKLLLDAKANPNIAGQGGYPPSPFELFLKNRSAFSLPILDMFIRNGAIVPRAVVKLHLKQHHDQQEAKKMFDVYRSFAVLALGTPDEMKTLTSQDQAIIMSYQEKLKNVQILVHEVGYKTVTDILEEHMPSHLATICIQYAQESSPFAVTIPLAITSKKKQKQLLGDICLWT